MQPFACNSPEREMRILRLRQARVSGQPLRVRIISPSDAEKNQFSQLQWSDYWIKYELIKALGQMPDVFISEYQPHVELHLLGFPAQMDPRIYTMAWIYGHPDMVTDIELMQYDHLFCYSTLFKRELERRGYPAELMLPATGKLPALVREKRYPATFVGNARPGGGARPAVDALLESGENFLVWGKGWETKLSQKNLAGSYFDYGRLEELYACSEFVLNDHHPDMARWGFVSFRIFDALAAGGFVISDCNPGIEEIFGDAVPQFSHGEELRDIMADLRAHPEKKEEMRRRGQQAALSHHWESRAAQLYWHLLWIADPSHVRIKGPLIRSPLISVPHQQRFDLVNQRLRSHIDLTGQNPSAEAPLKMNPAEIRLARPKVFYIDLFKAENSNLYWLGAFKKIAEVDTFDLRENIAELRQRILDFRPDHIHMGGSVKNGIIRPELLQEMKNALGCSISNFYGDAAYSEYHVELARVTDHMYITNKTHIALNAEKGFPHFTYLPCPTDPETFRPFGGEKIYDLLFIGNNNNLSRLELLTRLARKYNLAVAGAKWEESGLNVLPSAFGETFSATCGKAKILLGLVGDEWKHLEAYFSNRLVNVLATGSFLLQTYTPGLETVFSNRQHLVWYENDDELHELIEHYLQSDAERKKIAQAGRAEVLAKYTYDHHVDLILKRGAQSCESLRPSQADQAAAIVATLPKAEPLGEPARPLKLHLGCGSNLLEGYVNIDKFNPKADRCQDAARLDFPDGSADEIFTSHMVEHVSIAEFKAMLKEWKRVMKKDARLVIRCPNFELYMRMWLERDENYRWGEGLNVILGMQDRGPGYQNRNMFTCRRLKELVSEAGFTVLRCEETETRTGHLPNGDLLCMALNRPPAQRAALRPTAPQKTEIATDPLDDHWRTALHEAEQGGRFTWEWYQNHPITRELLRSSVLKGKVLEIGCGTGQRAAIAQQASGCHIIGMDASNFAVKYAREHFGTEQLEFVPGDVMSLPFPNRTFDHAYMLAVIEHIPDTAQLLMEIERVLKPGGKLFLSVTENNFHSSPDHVHIFTPNTLRDAFQGYEMLGSVVQDHIIFATIQMRAARRSEKISQNAAAAPLGTAV